MAGFLDWQGQCPYCGETITVYIDPGNNDSHYIEDCSVCCRPINVTVTGVHDESGYCIEGVLLSAENE